MLYENIKKLVQYGIETGLTPACEKNYTTNLLLDLFKEDDYVEPEEEYTDIDLEEVLKGLLDEAVSRGIIEDSVVYRDLFDTKIMNCLMPRPAQVQKEFWDRYEKDPQEATDYFYKLSQDSDYIRRYRVKKDQKWTVDSEYGTIDITINLSKPEKDPKAIAAAKLAKSSSYPKCLLCPENEGYAGRINHPARENHRIIPITVNDSPWGFQYSPYVYYNEHCIVFNSSHVPMKIERNTFIKLFDFVKLFPHYFLGSNADLPIVGGSILSHDHFQGGHYTFAMAKAPIEKHVTIPGYEDVEAGIVKWPLSVLRIRHKDEKRLIDLATHVVIFFQDICRLHVFSNITSSLEDNSLFFHNRNLTVDNLFLQLHIWNSVAEQSTRFVLTFKNSYLMTSSIQKICCRKSGRTGTYDSHFLAGTRLWRLRSSISFSIRPFYD